MRVLYARLEARYYQIDLAAVSMRKLLNLTAEFIVELNQYDADRMAAHHNAMEGPDAVPEGAIKLTPEQLDGSDRSDLVSGL